MNEALLVLGGLAGFASVGLMVREGPSTGWETTVRHSLHRFLPLFLTQAYAAATDSRNGDPDGGGSGS